VIYHQPDPNLSALPEDSLSLIDLEGNPKPESLLTLYPVACRERLRGSLKYYARAA